MKTARKYLAPLLLSLLAVLAVGCASDRQEIRKTLTGELNLLKEMDTETGSSTLVSLEGKTPEESAEISQIFPLFFQDFRYKILSIHLDRKDKTATADLRLTTLDGSALARDYKKASLEEQILASAGETGEESPLLQGYRTLYNLLKENTYPVKKLDTTVSLRYEEKNKSWEIIRTDALEDALAGGLLSSLSDSGLLTPEETLTVYLNTLKKMDRDQMSTFLGTDSVRSDLGTALMDQLKEHFDWKITSSSVSGITAEISVEITTFDSEGILSAYQDSIKDYLDSPQAVIDGPEKREEYCRQVLLEQIESNKKKTARTGTITLVNDGSGWQPQDLDSELGSLLFGPLSDASIP